MRGAISLPIRVVNEIRQLLDGRMGDKRTRNRLRNSLEVILECETRLHFEAAVIRGLEEALAIGPARDLVR